MSGVKSGRAYAFRIGDLLAGRRCVYVIVGVKSRECTALGFDTLDSGTQVWVNDECVEARLFSGERVIR